MMLLNNPIISIFSWIINCENSLLACDLLGYNFLAVN